MQQRMYSLFERGTDGRWVRINSVAIRGRQAAARVFQDALLAPFIGPNAGDGTLRERMLRPVREPASA